MFHHDPFIRKGDAMNKKNTIPPHKKPSPSEPVDPYTGEVEPAAEDAYKFIEVIPVEPDEEADRLYLAEEEDPMDAIAADTQADAVVEQIIRYTEDEDIREEFAERQGFAYSGRAQLEEELDEHNFQNPQISGGDLDAAWDASVQAGDEAVGGSVITPDQDIVENLGEAVGLPYADDEPLNTEEKLLKRDRARWELNPESAEEAVDENEAL